MTPLSSALVEAAAIALGRADKAPLTERAVIQRQEDAKAVVVAVLARLGGKKGEQGLLPYGNGISQQLLEMADELDER